MNKLRICFLIGIVCAPLVSFAGSGDSILSTVALASSISASIDAQKAAQNAAQIVTDVPVLIKNIRDTCLFQTCYQVDDIDLFKYKCPAGTLNRILWVGGVPKTLICLKKTNP